MRKLNRSCLFLSIDFCNRLGGERIERYYYAEILCIELSYVYSFCSEWSRLRRICVFFFFRYVNAEGFVPCYDLLVAL